MQSEGGQGLQRRVRESITIEKVPLAFQDLRHLFDPGLTDSRVCSLEDIALDPTLWPSGGQGKATRITLEIPLQS